MSAQWQPTALLAGGAIVAIGLLVYLIRPGEPPAPTAPTAPASTSVAPKPVTSFADPPDATVAPAPSTSNSNLIWNADAGVYMLRLDNGELLPLPPGVTSASITPPLPPEKAQTNEWKLEKTQRIFKVVDDRAKRVDKEADDLEQVGKKQEAAEKRMLAARLRKQMDSMKTEMGGFQKQIVDDGGVVDGDVYYDAAKP